MVSAKQGTTQKVIMTATQSDTNKWFIFLEIFLCIIGKMIVYLQII